MNQQVQKKLVKAEKKSNKLMDKVLTSKANKAYIMSLFNNTPTSINISNFPHTTNGTVGATIAASSNDGAKDDGMTLTNVSLRAILKKATANKGEPPK